MTAIALALLRQFWPYAVAAAVAFSAAWAIQGLRLDAAANEMDGFKIAIKQQVVASRAHNQKVNEEVSNDWIKNIDALHAYYRSQPRSVLSAGDYPSGAGISRIPEGSGQRSADASPGAGESAATVEECAETTLLFLECRAWAKKLTKTSRP